MRSHPSPARASDCDQASELVFTTPMADEDRRAASSTCAWCLASFPSGGLNVAHRVHPLRPPHGANSLRTRRPRSRTAHLARQPARASLGASDDDSPSDASNDKDDKEPEYGSGDFTDPKLFLDMEALRKRIRDVEESPNEDETTTLKSGDLDGVEIEISSANLGDIEDSGEAMKFVEQFESISSLWVIIFTSREEKEGVYSLSLGEESIVLAFQERREAQRYAKMLEGQDFPTAKVCRLESDELREFCLREGFRLGFVPAGSLLAPPGESAIEDEAQWGITAEVDHPPANGDNDGSSGLSAEEVELMKRRLENLFGNNNESL